MSSLLARSASRLAWQDPGFDYKHVAIVDPQLRTHGFSPGRAQSYLEDLKTRISAIPGVKKVSVATAVPLSGRSVATWLPGGPRTVHVVNAGADYFKTMSIPLVRGRTFARDDRKVVILNEALARSVWPGQEAIGRLYNGERTVIGMAASTRAWMGSGPEVAEGAGFYELYEPLVPEAANEWVLVVRYAGAANRPAPLASAAARDADPQIVAAVRPGPVT